MVTKIYKVYGKDGHRQAVSFQKSKTYDFSNGENIRILELKNSDITGTNDYTLLMISRNTTEEVKSELEGQISDGIFENYNVGKIEEV